MKNAIVWVMILLCCWLMYRYPLVMLNPGELVEGHQDLNNKCLSCHKPFWGISDAKCISCHKLSEIGKDTLKISDTLLAKGKILFHQHLENQKCTECHTDHNGLVPEHPISGFKHELLSATLISKCSDCHTRPLDTLHQFLSLACKNCHNLKGWKTAVLFNHDMIEGIDKNNCTSCHQIPKDSYHKSLKDNCSQCHSTSKWVPATFDHLKYFQLDKDHNTTCITCHTNNNFKVYTCYGCHEHSQNKMAQKHNEEGIFDFDDCVSCHKSANEHDIIRNGKSKNESNPQEINRVNDNVKSRKKHSKNEADEKNESDDD